MPFESDPCSHHISPQLLTMTPPIHLPFLPPLDSTVGNQGATQVPAESLPMDIDGPGAQRSGKRKRAASPDDERGEKRTRSNKQQQLVAQGHTQVSLVRNWSELGKWIVTVFISDAQAIMPGLRRSPRFLRSQKLTGNE